MNKKWGTLLSIAGMLAATGCYEQETPEGLGSATDGASASDSDSGGTGGASDSAGSASDGSDGGSDTDGGSDSDTDGGTDSDTGADGSELEELIGSLCTWDFNCCSRGEIDYRLGPFTSDAANCTERYIEQLHSNDDVAESQRGDLLYTLGFAVRLDRSQPNPDMVNQCRDLIEQRQCNQPFDGEVYCEPGDDPVENPCDLRNLFTGTQTVGDPCSEALANLGFDIECEAGSSCEEVDGTYVCVDKGLVDDFCEADFTCDQGLFCNISTGRCQEKSDIGQPCSFENPAEPDAGSEDLPCKEHLSCDPSSDTCVQYCTTGFDCSDDSQCGSGESCIPVDMGDNTYSYCLAQGDTNGDRCDSDRDCGDNFHCTGSSCAADRAQGTSCTADNQCQAGLYCDLGGTGDCEIVFNANETCSNSRECNTSTTMGCMTSDNGARCRTALLSNGDACVPGERDGGNWCASGVCEDTTDDLIANPECHTGASVGDECDSSAATLDVHQCADGLYCNDDGLCALKLDAGGNCSEDGGQQCLNGSCSAIWEGDFCTDAVPFEDIEVVATCDGQE
jgi:hypothetical protein